MQRVLLESSMANTLSPSDLNALDSLDAELSASGEGLQTMENRPPSVRFKRLVKKADIAGEPNERES